MKRIKSKHSQKIKNPCKYCCQSVTHKNGIQCRGACKKWAHYQCLNFTPGKIADIKAGIIQVLCPCPDCESVTPKEVLVRPPSTRSNIKYDEPVDCPSQQKLSPTYLKETKLNSALPSDKQTDRVGPPNVCSTQNLHAPPYQRESCLPDSCFPDAPPQFMKSKSELQKLVPCKSMPQTRPLYSPSMCESTSCFPGPYPTKTSKHSQPQYRPSQPCSGAKNPVQSGMIESCPLQPCLMKTCTHSAKPCTSRIGLSPCTPQQCPARPCPQQCQTPKNLKQTSGCNLNKSKKILASEDEHSGILSPNKWKAISRVLSGGSLKHLGRSSSSASQIYEQSSMQCTLRDMSTTLGKLASQVKYLMKKMDK